VIVSAVPYSSGSATRATGSPDAGVRVLGVAGSGAVKGVGSVRTGAVGPGVILVAVGYRGMAGAGITVDVIAKLLPGGDRAPAARPTTDGDAEHTVDHRWSDVDQSGAVGP
jgi:hypothetical protein